MSTTWKFLFSYLKVYIKKWTFAKVFFHSDEREANVLQSLLKAFKLPAILKIGTQLAQVLSGLRGTFLDDRPRHDRFF